MLSILEVNTYDSGGGAEQIAMSLTNGFREYGHLSWLAVGAKTTDDPNIFPIDGKSGFRNQTRCISALQNVICPDNIEASEYFDYPAAWGLIDLAPEKIDILHCHNLHTNYFDLRALAWLSKRIPVVITLHDAWLLTGNCAHYFECRRWKTGCGECPDTTIYPGLKKDITAQLWQMKRSIFKKSQLYISSPSRWLIDNTRESILHSAVVEKKVIHNGVNTEIYKPSEQRLVRQELNLPEDAFIMLFVGNTTKTNLWKDFETLKRACLNMSGKINDQKIIFIVLGEKFRGQKIGDCEIKFYPYEYDRAKVAAFFQASDIYIHAAKVDTFPNTILEALSCGTPVIATAVGGIPEQVRGFQAFNRMYHENCFPLSKATGILVPKKDDVLMAEAILYLQKNADIMRSMGVNARNDALARFNYRQQINNYIDWFREIKNKWSIPSYRN